MLSGRQGWLLKLKAWLPICTIPQFPKPPESQDDLSSQREWVLENVNTCKENNQQPSLPFVNKNRQWHKCEYEPWKCVSKAKRGSPDPLVLVISARERKKALNSINLQDMQTRGFGAFCFRWAPKRRVSGTRVSWHVLHAIYIRRCSLWLIEDVFRDLSVLVTSWNHGGHSCHARMAN